MEQYPDAKREKLITEMNKAADAMINLLDKSNLDVEELAPSIPRVTGVTSITGVANITDIFATEITKVEGGEEYDIGEFTLSVVPPRLRPRYVDPTINHSPDNDTDPISNLLDSMKSAAKLMVDEMMEDDKDTHYERAVLSSTDILKYYSNETIIISPFNKSNLSNTSYDVTLGDNYYLARPELFGYQRSEYSLSTVRSEPIIFNPWDKADIDKYWNTEKPLQAITDPKKYNGRPHIIIPTSGKILAHTNEFIGTRAHSQITTMMKARSSIGRVNVSVCTDAGWGDIGYCNRWTMEIANNSGCPIVLFIGMRIAQIIFFTSSHPLTSYEGKYQSVVDEPILTAEQMIEQMTKDWNPAMMLPKLYKDLN